MRIKNDPVDLQRKFPAIVSFVRQKENKQMYYMWIRNLHKFFKWYMAEKTLSAKLHNVKNNCDYYFLSYWKKSFDGNGNLMYVIQVICKRKYLITKLIYIVNKILERSFGYFSRKEIFEIMGIFEFFNLTILTIISWTLWDLKV